MNYNLLRERWGSDAITGDVEAEKPPYAVFKNTVKAVQLLNKHIRRNSKIAIHCDVDCDGIGSGYILKRTLDNLGCTNQILLINKDKVHGIQQKHVDFFKNYKIDLLIIVDSSTNEIDYLKQFNCDVLVIDHHLMLKDETFGVTLNGEHEFVIVNNVIENNEFKIDKEWLCKIKPDAFENLIEYKSTSDMSCGLTVYELLRIYCVCYADEKLLENLMLYQWVGITLFTDAINLLNDRNQWYIGKTVNSMETEHSLNVTMAIVNRYRPILSKTYISYNFAPLINKSIRAGAGSEALDICLNRPQDIGNLMQYSAIQKEVLNRAIKENEVFTGSYICKDVTALDISVNYCGVIASRLCGDNNKNTAVYGVKDGIAKGSFRGRHSLVDYRAFFEGYKPGIYAQGHEAAFGFELELGLLYEIMGKLNSIEPTGDERVYLTAGHIDLEHRGVNHIDDFDEFKRAGLLWRLGIGNSRVGSKDEIDIVVPILDVKLKEIKGSVYFYDVLGLECKAFEPITTSLAKVYVEYTGELSCYLRNM